MLAFPFREGKLRVGVRAGIRALSLRTLPLRDSAGLDLSRGVTGLSPFGTAHPGAGAPSPQPLLDYHDALLYHVRRSESNLAMRRVHFSLGASSAVHAPNGSNAHKNGRKTVCSSPKASLESPLCGACPRIEMHPMRRSESQKRNDTRPCVTLSP